MATVKVTFDGGIVPVVTGDKPAAADKPIANPSRTGGVTNIAFPAAPGVHCYGLETAEAYTPLWQMGTVIDGIPTELGFKKVVP